MNLESHAKSGQPLLAPEWHRRQRMKEQEARRMSVEEELRDKNKLLEDELRISREMFKRQSEKLDSLHQQEKNRRNRDTRYAISGGTVYANTTGTYYMNSF